MKFDINWFNASPRFVRLFGTLFKPYNLFSRKYDHGLHDWGFGLIQLDTGHLFFIGKIDGKRKFDILFLSLLPLTLYLPFDRIHHIEHFFGRLIIPTPKGWIALFDKRQLRHWNGGPIKPGYSFRQRFRIVKRKDYHNCRATGRY